MNGKPDTVIINVRDYAGTYIATAKAVAIKATCTSGYQQAAEACADKVYGHGNYTLTQDAAGAAIWTAAAIKPAAWRTDLPDDDITVLVRMNAENYPITTATHCDGCWLSDVTGLLIDPIVTGWMHLEDAARILDAARA